MSLDPPPSPLETPDPRRRLQQQYELAQRLASGPAPDFRRIHDLLADCLRSDPGSILYLDALLANLRRWVPKPRGSWWPKWLRGWWGQVRKNNAQSVEPGSDQGPSTQYLVLSTSLDQATTLLHQAPDLLLLHYLDPVTLRQLAAACEACDLPEAELRYLQAARDAVPDDPDTLRMLARSLTRQGHFEDAMGPWFAVLALAPNTDAEAEQAVEDLRGSQECIENVEPLSERFSEDVPDATTALREARRFRDSGNLVSAGQYLRHAQAISGGDLAIWHEREELQLARSAASIGTGQAAGSERLASSRKSWWLAWNPSTTAWKSTF